MVEFPDYVGPDYAEHMFTDIRELRRRLPEVWQRKGICLIADELQKLRDEIGETCMLLDELTRTD